MHLDATRFLVGSLSTAFITLLFVGCGPADLGRDEPIATTESPLTINTAGPYGNTSGTQEGPGSDQQTKVLRIEGWADTTYVYGIKLHYNGGTSKMFGSSVNGVHTNVTLTSGWWSKVEYNIDQVTGYFRGMKATNNDGTISAPIGYISAVDTAFNSTGAKFTDMVTYGGPVMPGPKSVLWGVKFYYTTP